MNAHSRSQRAQAIVLVAFMLAVVVGMAALAIDGSRAYAVRRDLQSAADAAALAAADNFQRTSSYVSAEAAASTAFGISLRLYSAPACAPGYGSPGPATYTVTCTYSDGTTLTDTLPIKGAQGAQFQLTASRNLSLQFARILTNGTSPAIAATSIARVNNLLYSPSVAALNQAGCGGTGGTAITVNGTGTLKMVGDLVSSGLVSVSSGSALVGGDVYARCQSTISGVSTGCYPSGGAQPCTYPDVAGVVRSGYRFIDPNYPTPSPIGGGAGVPGSNVFLSPGVYSAPVILAGGRCYFLAGGVYDWQAGYINVDDLVSNELKPPDEPLVADNTQRSPNQFWDATGQGCSGYAQFSATNGGHGQNCNGNGNGNGNGNCNVPQGLWSFVITSTRTDTYNGVTYQRESAPSMCYQVTVGQHQKITVDISNVPGATGYNIYAAPPNNGCAGPFGLADNVPVSGSVQNNNLNPCPSFSGNGCSLGHESQDIDNGDIGPPFTPNAAAAPGTSGAYPPNSETAPIAAGLPNQNPARGPGAAGDRANENNCSNAAGFVTCPGTTPGAVVFYLPGSACMLTANTSDTYVFSGYQYNWIAFYEPPANTCSNLIGANVNSAFVGLVYSPGASMAFLSAAVFSSSGMGGVIADTISFSGGLPSLSFSASYAPVPFAARLTS